MKWYKDLIIYLILGISFLFMLTFFLFFRIEALLAFIPDDAGFYLKIAENASKGILFSYDGINKTNGFHPLWLIVSTLPHFFIQNNPELIIRLSLILCQIFLVSAFIMIYAETKKKFSFSSNLTGLTFYLFLVIFPFSDGMESALVIFLTAVFFRFYIKLINGKSNNNHFLFLCGIIAGLLFLSRLDTIILLLVAFIYFVYEIKREKNATAKTVYLPIIGFLLLSLPYILYNYINFDSIMPISGSLKSSFPSPGFYFFKSIILIKSTLMLVLCSGLFSILYIILVLIKKIVITDSFNKGVLVLSLGVVLHLLHQGLFMKWHSFDWHYAFYSVSLVLQIIYFSNKIFGKLSLKSSIIYSGLITVCLIAFGYRVNQRLNYEKYPNEVVLEYKYAKIVKNVLKENEAVAFEGSAIFGFLTSGLTINLDGLANNFEFQKIIRDKKLNLYLKRNNVKYIFLRIDKTVLGEIFDNNFSEVTHSYFSYKYEVFSDPVLFKKENEILRIYETEIEGKQLAYAIFKFEFNK